MIYLKLLFGFVKALAAALPYALSYLAGRRGARLRAERIARRQAEEQRDIANQPRVTRAEILDQMRKGGM